MDQRDGLGTIAYDLCALAAAWSVMPVASGEGLKISTTTRVPENLNHAIIETASCGCEDTFLCLDPRPRVCLP